MFFPHCSVDISASYCVAEILHRLTYALYIFCSLRVFSFAGIIGLLFLLPINCLGTQLAAFDITIISSETLDLFTISNVNNGSKW